MNWKALSLLLLLGGTAFAAETRQILSVRIHNSDQKMAGAAAIGSATTVWNNLVYPSSLSTSTLSQDVFDKVPLVDQDGKASGAALTWNLAGTSYSVSALPHYWSNAGVLDPVPSALMTNYSYYWWNASLTGKVSGLVPGKVYRLYGYGTGDADNQGSAWAFAKENGGASMEAKADFSATKSTRNVTLPSNLGHSFVQLDGTAGTDGVLTFVVKKNSNGTDPFFTGFQLATFPVGQILVQPASSASFLAGSSFSLVVASAGEGSFTYQWRKDGVPLTGNASALSSTLTVANAQAADAGSYDVIVTNPGGSLTSSACVVSLVSAVVAPTMDAQPKSVTGVLGDSLRLDAIALGTHSMAYQWQKSSDGKTFVDIQGATGISLLFTSVKTDDGGYYRVKVTNSAGSVTSAAATVDLKPVLSTALTNSAVTPNTAFSVTASASAGTSPSALVYQWFKDGVALADGMNLAGSKTATLSFVSFGASDSGLYSVTVSNAAGAVSSNTAYIGAKTTLTSTLWPAAGATGVNPDSPLRIVFSGPVRVGTQGKVAIYDASNDALVESYNLGDYISFSATTDGGTLVTVPGFTNRTVQGNSYQYQPLAAFGNELWIRTSSSTKLAYGKSYYVTVDMGVALDAQGATHTGVAAGAWKFSTKASAPTASTLTVAADGSGDFTTIQGACNMVPKNNSAATPYTINIAPGIYREHVFLAENRNFVTLRGTGPSRTSAQIVDIGVDGSYNAVVRLLSTDLRLQNLTMENTVGPVGPKMTLLTNANRQVLENCLIKGWQDTLAAWSGAVYFKNCEVWGSVDFIYSGALAVFDSCDLIEIRESGGYFTAPSTPGTQKYGLVFLNSRFLRGQKRNGQPYDVKPGSTYLMRPWYPDGMTSVINCYTDDVVPAKGWAEWGGRENTCRAYEYGTKIIGGGPVTAADRVAAGAYWVKAADPADYTLTAILGAFAPLATGTTQDYNSLTGSAVTLNIPVSASSYQWYHNGAVIVGATSSSLALSNLQARDAGLYTLVATSAAGQVSTYTNTVNVLTAGGVATPVQAVTGHLQQFSLRAVAGLGEDSMIIGFAVDSAGSRDMLLRAIGPGLSRFGLTGYLANPKLSVYRGATLIAQNDDWSTGLFAADIAAAANTTGAFSLATGSLDSAVYTRLSPNGYSAVVSSVDSSTGIVLLESYDATNTSVEARLSSISGRAKVGQGDEVLIIGFVVGGNAPAKVLVRAVGPGLTALGVKTALPDPKLELYSGGALLSQNDNWQNGVAGIETTMASLGLIALGNGSKDAATYVTLEPGIYSAVVRSADTNSGVVLLQVLEVK